MLAKLIAKYNLSDWRCLTELLKSLPRQKRVEGEVGNQDTVQKLGNARKHDKNEERVDKFKSWWGIGIIRLPERLYSYIKGWLFSWGRSRYFWGGHNCQDSCWSRVWDLVSIYCATWRGIIGCGCDACGCAFPKVNSIGAFPFSQLNFLVPCLWRSTLRVSILTHELPRSSVFGRLIMRITGP